MISMARAEVVAANRDARLNGVPSRLRLFLGRGKRDPRHSWKYDNRHMWGRAWRLEDHLTVNVYVVRREANVS